jgi:hypothetical protein
MIELNIMINKQKLDNCSYKLYSDLIFMMCFAIKISYGVFSKHNRKKTRQNPDIIVTVCVI